MHEMVQFEVRSTWMVQATHVNILGLEKVALRIHCDSSSCTNGTCIRSLESCHFALLQQACNQRAQCCKLVESAFL